jgi:hypothetical protein
MQDNFNRPRGIDTYKAAAVAADALSYLLGANVLEIIYFIVTSETASPP